MYLSNKGQEKKFFGVVWSSEQAHVADAMAAGGDEGRTNLR